MSLGITNEDLFLREYAESFIDEFKFVARVLSVRNKMQFLVISATIAELLIPLIHKYFSVEKIYLYSSTNDQSSHDWMKSFSKVVSYWTDLKNLSAQINIDIDSWSQRHCTRDQSDKLFLMIDCQTIDSNTALTLQLSSSMSDDNCLVTFHCEDPLFHASGGPVYLSEFIDINTCIQFIIKQPESHVFLVISSDMRSSDLQSILNLKQICAIYYLRTNDVVLPINTKTMGGLLNDLDDLATQLRNDLHFSRQKKLHSLQIRVSPVYNATKKLIPQLGGEHVEFLTFQLFVNILPQIPTLMFTKQEILSELEALFIEPTDDCQRLIKRINTNTTIVYEDSPSILKIVSWCMQHKQLHHLLMLSELLSSMLTSHSQPDNNQLPFSAYRADIMLK
jgi:hypothetical protein